MLVVQEAMVVLCLFIFPAAGVLLRDEFVVVCCSFGCAAEESDLQRTFASKKGCQKEEERQLAREALAASAPARPREPGVGPRCATYAQIPPGCTPRLQWGMGLGGRHEVRQQ
jgi:hypothetical protein